MKVAKRFLSLILAIVLVGTLFVGCGEKAKETVTETKEAAPAATETKEAAPAPAAEKEAIYIPVISKGFQHQFWQAVKQGAEQAAADYGVEITFEGPETEAMVDKQIEMIETALSKNPAAICLAALDSQAVIPLLQRAKDAGIPVVGFDSGVDSDIPVATAATDNLAASALAADKMAEAIGGKGQVAVIVHDQTSRTGIDRRDGFVAQMESKYPDIEIVDIQYGEGDQLKSTEISKSIMQAYPDLKGFFGANEGSIIGVLNAAKELGKENSLVIIGYDSGKQQIDAIKSGVEYGAVTQDPIGIGYKAVEAAVKAINGETLEKSIDTGFLWFDKTNIDNADIKARLYE